MSSTELVTSILTQIQALFGKFETPFPIDDPHAPIGSLIIYTRILLEHYYPTAIEGSPAHALGIMIKTWANNHRICPVCSSRCLDYRDLDDDDKITGRLICLARENKNKFHCSMTDDLLLETVEFFGYTLDNNLRIICEVHF
jgi:hypothetical protein